MKEGRRDRETLEEVGRHTLYMYTINGESCMKDEPGIVMALFTSSPVILVK